MASHQNAEYHTLRQFTHDLSTVISLELTEVATKLFAVQLISQELWEKTDDGNGDGKYKKAKNIMIQVINQVKLHPKKFSVFLNKLKECNLAEDVVERVEQKYEKNKLVGVQNFVNDHEIENTEEDRLLDILQKMTSFHQPSISQHVSRILKMALLIAVLFILYQLFQYLSTESKYHGFLVTPLFKCAILVLMVWLPLCLYDCIVVCRKGSFFDHPFRHFMTKRQYFIFMDFIATTIGLPSYIYAGIYTIPTIFGMAAGSFLLQFLIVPVVIIYVLIAVSIIAVIFIQITSFLD